RDTYRARGAGEWFLNRTPFGRGLVLSRARAETRRRTGGHYPAPLAALRVIEHTLGRPLSEALEIEAASVSDVLTGAVCKNLVRLFQLQEQAKKENVTGDPAVQPAAVERMVLAG